jgi:DNA-directed RNA polymerase subunit RPC12/RpoP
MRFGYRFLDEFMTEISVECPRCGSKALVISCYSSIWKASFICPSCSSRRIWAGDSTSFVTAHSNYAQYEGILSGPPVDSFFRYPLWYQSEYKGEVLYAYNLAHLNWLKQYLGARLRERMQTAHGWSNQSLQSRLPQWMLTAKNRASIIKKILDLEKK